MQDGSEHGASSDRLLSHQEKLLGGIQIDEDDDICKQKPEECLGP